MQWRVLVGILFALVVAVFAVVNVHVEPINYVFGVAHLPLVLIILGSALLGALALAVLGLMGRMKLATENRRLRREVAQLKGMNEQLLAVSDQQKPTGDAGTLEFGPNLADLKGVESAEPIVAQEGALEESN